MTRGEFMDKVYSELYSDGDNYRANRIIDAADEYVETELQPCDDCISREEAIRVAEQGQIQGYEWQFKKLCTLPSVTPQPKIGHWEYVQYDSNPNIGNWHCSECRGICTEMHSIEDAYNYCPNCGAKMMEVEE